MIFSYASRRRISHLLSNIVDYFCLTNGLRHKKSGTWMVVAMARWVVHRLPVSIGLRIVAFRRLLYLCELFFYFDLLIVR